MADHVLLILDETTDPQILTEPGATTGELHDFSYRNATPHAIGLTVAEDLDRFAGWPASLRAAAYGAMRRWLTESRDMWTPVALATWDTAVADAVAAWRADASDEAAAAWDAAGS